MNTFIDISKMSVSESLNKIGEAIDSAWDDKRADDLKRTKSLIEQLKKLSLTSEQTAELLYLEANNHAAIRAVLYPKSKQSLDWEIPEFDNEFICVRKAATSEGFEKLSVSRRCQILTNLASRFSEVGRSVEALEYYDAAIRLLPKFGMALGNRGIALCQYALITYDEGHGRFLLWEARNSLQQSCESKNLEPGAFECFRRKLDEIHAVKKPVFEEKESDFGSSHGERQYRSWCLENRLFLNALNEISSAHPLAVRDVLAMPTLTTSTPKIPHFFKFFNIIKQEYVSARYLLFLGQSIIGPHFSDSNVLLYDTLDDPIHSFPTQLSRLAFRSAYSIFDKIGFFLRDYFGLEIDPKAVSFRSIWYVGSRKKSLNPIFQNSKNWPLRGLFWLSKDLFETSNDYAISIEPDAKNLKDIRDHLEHKFLSLHWNVEERENFQADGMLTCISSDFDKKALKILKLVRSALIYLFLTVHLEEKKRNPVI